MQQASILLFLQASAWLGTSGQLAIFFHATIGDTTSQVKQRIHLMAAPEYEAAENKKGRRTFPYPILIKDFPTISFLTLCLAKLQMAT